MSVEAKFVEPTTEMVEFIAKNMRKADADEVWASHRHTPIEALMDGWRVSDRSVVVTVGDEPCVMMGLVIRDILTGTGVPWLLGTEGAIKHKRHFIDLVPPVIDEMLSICPRLFNYVHADNKVSIRWLKHIGFTIEDAAEHGHAGEMFHKFHLERV